MVFWDAWHTSAAGRLPPGAALPFWQWAASVPLDLQSTGSGHELADQNPLSVMDLLGYGSVPSVGVEAHYAGVFELPADCSLPSVSTSVAQPAEHGDRARPPC